MSPDMGAIHAVYKVHLN